MPTVEPFSRAQIQTYLRSKNVKYLTDSDGDFQVPFGYVESTGCRLTLFLQAEGQQLNVYSIRVRTNRDIPKAEWGRVGALCNEWNADRRWPKAYLEVADPATASAGEVILEQHYDLEPGIHQELLDHLTESILSGAIHFWEWAHQEHGL